MLKFNETTFKMHHLNEYMVNFKSIKNREKNLTKTTKQIGPTRLQTTLSYIDNQQLKK